MRMTRPVAQGLLSLRFAASGMDSSCGLGLGHRHDLVRFDAHRIVRSFRS